LIPIPPTSQYQAILWSKNGVNKATGGRTKSWGNCG